MKYLLYLMAAGFIFYQACEPAAVEPADEGSSAPLKPVVILDTDIAVDCDDAGAVAVLHALSDKKEVDILGMMVSMPAEYGAPALDAINTFYDHPNIPIGTIKKKGSGDGAALKVYNKDLAMRFQNDLRHAVHAPDARILYRQLLAGQPDRSVTIVTIGPLTNLYNLMKSSPDSISPLDGMELINAKVRLLVTAGGKLPQGTSYNFYMAPDETGFVIERWPTEHWFVPNELGDDVLTGKELITATTNENPVSIAYRLYRARYPHHPFRPSWDQMGVLIAVRGKAGLFKTNTKGSVSSSRGKISWNGTPDRNHVWFQNNSTPEQRRKVVEELMSPPVN